MSTIAATRTRTGLTVRAEIDPGQYPTGIAISPEEFAALPLRRHEVHGEWNYTLDPDLSAPARTLPSVNERALARRAALNALADPRLTGQSIEGLHTLCARLAPAQEAQTEQRCHEQRGGPRRKKRGCGGPSLLTDTDKIVVTLVYERQHASQRTLEEFTGINSNTIGAAIAQTRQIFHEAKITVPTTRIRFASAADLTIYLRSATPPEPLVTRPSDILTAPVLTGMTAEQFKSLADTLAPIQASRRVKHRHNVRGGERLPGARGGVFIEKINDGERVLIAVLHQRNIARQEVLAELFGVSRRTISNVVREVEPLLQSLGHTSTPIPLRYPNTQAIQDAITTSNTPT